MMKLQHAAAALRAMTLAASAVMLAACGGGGGSEPPPSSPATVQAAPDAATLAWNAPGTIDVLANDSASRGGVTLVSVTAGAHGTAEVSGGSVRYTPDAGFVGADTLSYTVRAADGGATAVGTVTVTVEARLQLSGIVSAAPLANAQLTARVGDAAFTATTDSQGAYAIEVRSSRLDDFVTLTAAGTGVQAAVKLVSLVGDVAALAAEAQGSAVPASRVPALNVTPVSTAVAVLTERRGTRAPPASSAALARAVSTLSADEVLRLAGVVRMVAHGVALLPQGPSDTLALLRDEASFDAFVQLHGVQIDQTPFLESQVLALAELPTSAGPQLAVGGPQTVAYFSGDDATALLVTYRPDGTATVHATNLADRQVSVLREATWQRGEAAVTLTFATPFVYVSAESQGIGSISTTGLVLKQASGDAAGGLSVVSLTGSAVVSGGPDDGQPFETHQHLFDGTPYRLMTTLDIERRLPVDASEVAAGRRLGGVLSLHTPGPTDVGSRDVLLMAANGAATLEATGQPVAWSLADRWLTVDHPGIDGRSVRYARLAADETTGEERWIAVVSQTGAEPGMWPIRVLVADADIGFTSGSAARVWHAGFASLVDPRQTLIHLYADGSASRGAAGTWALSTSGDIHMEFPSRFSVPAVTQLRDWRPLKRRGTRVWLLQSISLGDSGYQSVTWYTDRGPAVK